MQTSPYLITLKHFQIKNNEDIMDQQPLTYQQLLAEQYEDNANQILAFAQTEYDNTEEDAPEYVINTYASERGVRGQALEDSHLFQQFAGNRNLEEDIIRPKDFEDKSKLSVRYNKDVKLNTFNIDSRFRAYINPGVLSGNLMINPANPVNESVFNPTAVSSAAHFIFRVPRLVKNAISIKLSSLELPNTFSNFSSARGNTIFQIREHGSANYLNVNIDPNDSSPYFPNVNLLTQAIQTALRALPLDDAATFECDTEENGYIYIINTATGSYDFNFGYNPLPIPIFDPLGVLMGFKTNQAFYQNITLSTSNPLIATYLPDLNADDYIYLKVNDYITVTPQTVNDTFFTVFAKIPITIDKGLMLYDNDSVNTTHKTYRFLLPTNIQQLEIQLLDRAGNELIFDGNYSMTIEIEEVLSQALYEKMREL
jgi:hypothetical protein